MSAIVPGKSNDINTVINMSVEGMKEFFAVTLKKYLKHHNLTELELFKIIDKDNTGFISRTNIEEFITNTKQFVERNPDTNVLLDKPLFYNFTVDAFSKNVHNELCKKNLKKKGTKLTYSNFLETLYEDVAHDQVVFRYQNAEIPDIPYFNINLSWNFGTFTSTTSSVNVSAYSTPASNKNYDNQDDVPRIRAYRDTGTTYSTYVSAGSAYENVTTHTVSAAPFGDRSVLSQNISIPFTRPSTAKVQLVTVPWKPAPILYPSISQWTFTKSGSFYFYELSFNNPGDYTVEITLPK